MPHANGLSMISLIMVIYVSNGTEPRHVACTSRASSWPKYDALQPLVAHERYKEKDNRVLYAKVI